MRTRLVAALDIACLISAVLLWTPTSTAPSARTAEALAVPRSLDASLEQQIVAKEREELDCLKTGDLERFAGLLADEAVFVDASGPASKAEVVKNVAGFRLTDYSMEGVTYLSVSTDSGLITYKITERGNSHGRQISATAYIAALWAKRGGKWVSLFSQETAAK